MLVLTKFSFWQGDWALVYSLFTSNNRESFHLWRKTKFSKTSKSLKILWKWLIDQTNVRYVRVWVITLNSNNHSLQSFDEFTFSVISFYGIYSLCINVNNRIIISISRFIKISVIVRSKILIIWSFPSLNDPTV